MVTTKRFPLVALLVLGATLSASSSVLAQSTITFTNTAGSKDRDSRASGQATLTDVSYAFSYELDSATIVYLCDFYEGYLTVSCSGLTPGATYRIGPTSTVPVIDPETAQTILATNYSYVTASDTGTVNVALNVLFVGSVAEYDWTGTWGSGYWVYAGTSLPDFSLSVARKHGSKYVTLLQGSFPYPY